MNGVLFAPRNMPRVVIDRRTGHLYGPVKQETVLAPTIIGTGLTNRTPGKSAGIFQIGNQTAFLSLNGVFHIGQGELSLGDGENSIVIENTRCSALIRTGKKPGDIFIANDMEDLQIEITRGRKHILVSHNPLNPTPLKPGDVLRFPLKSIGSERPRYLKVIVAKKEEELAPPQPAVEEMLASKSKPEIQRRASLPYLAAAASALALLAATSYVTLKALSNSPSISRAESEDLEGKPLRNMGDLVSIAEAGNLEYEIITTRGFSLWRIEFFDKRTGRQIAMAEEIPYTGMSHYFYDVRSNGKKIGVVQDGKGLHFFGLDGKYMAWARPAGFSPKLGVKDVKVGNRNAWPTSTSRSSSEDLEGNPLRNMGDLVSIAEAGNLQARKITALGFSSSRIEFTDKRNGRLIAVGEGITNTGHYFYNVYSNGNLIGRVKGMVGWHFYGLDGKEMAWARPVGSDFSPQPGIKDVTVGMVKF